MLDLVTNRTIEHVKLLKTLSERTYWEWSEEEKEVWLNEAAKGAYNYKDLNRVETAVKIMAPLLNLTLTTKTDWVMTDVPTQSEMERYLNNVVIIRDACPHGISFPPLPSSMSGLTFEGANNIEMVLSLAIEYLAQFKSSTLGKAELGTMVLGLEG